MLAAGQRTKGMTAVRVLSLLLLPVTVGGSYLYQPTALRAPVQALAVYGAPEALPSYAYVARPPVAPVASRSSNFSALLFGGFLGTAAATLALSGRAARIVTSRLGQSSVRMQGAGALKTKKIFVLGGDGFCGWPTALHLSDKGHEVVIIDNLSRRKIDVELGCSSLTPIASPETRVNTWNELTGKNLRFEYIDLAN